MERVVRFGVSIEPKLLSKFDSLVGRKGYKSRSEAVRDLIRDLIVEEAKKKEKGRGVGALSIIYDHDTRGISDKLTDIQHKHQANIVASMHVHLDKHNCMEVLVIRGRVADIKRIADTLISSRGVKHGKLVMTPAGKELT